MTTPADLYPGAIVATTKMLSRPCNTGGPVLFPGTLGEVLGVGDALARVDFRAFGVKIVHVADLRLAGSSAQSAEYETYLETEVARLEGHVTSLQQALESLLQSAGAPRLVRSWGDGS